jgi:predicted secreted Zn-dependent protease
MEKAGFLRADHVAVDVTAIVILPYWRVPRSAKDELVARWEHYIAALRAHERGHVAIAGAAGRAVAEQIAAISPCGSLDSLKRAVAEAASAAVAEHRERERAYDTETQHGALEGVRLPEEYGL